jgi:hypothetical protein
MKLKFKFNVTVYLIVLGIYSPCLNSQTPQFLMVMGNGIQVAANEYQFDIYIQNWDSVPIELAGCQLGLLFNNAIKNGGTLIVSFVPGTTDSSIINAGMQNTNFNASTTYTSGGFTWGVIKMAAKLPPGGAGTGAIISNVFPGTRIGRIRMVNSVPFAHDSVYLKYSFNINPYATKVSAYIPPGGGGINTDITMNGDFRNGVYNDILPVELSTFELGVKGRDVVLNWSTETEKNSDRFEIQRSTDSQNWEVIASVKAANLSNSTKEYSYTDRKLQTAKYKYKLKMIDNDGTFTYSKIVEAEVGLPEIYALSQNYPNPFNPAT